MKLAMECLVGAIVGLGFGSVLGAIIFWLIPSAARALCG